MGIYNAIRVCVHLLLAAPNVWLLCYGENGFILVMALIACLLNLYWAWKAATDEPL